MGFFCTTYPAASPAFIYCDRFGGTDRYFFGIVISEHGKLAFPVLGVTNPIYTIPSIAMLGFLVPATGIGDTTAVIALTVYGLLPMVRNTHRHQRNFSGYYRSREGDGVHRVPAAV